MTSAAPLPDLGWPWRRTLLAAADPASLDDPSREHDDAWLLSLYAGLAARAQRVEVALLFLQAAVRRDPENVRYLSRLGELLGRVGRHREAVSFLWRAVHRRRQDGHLRLQLARALQRMARWKRAQVMLEAAIALSPSRGDLWIDLGELLQRRGRSSAADEAFMRAADIGARDVDVQARLGHIFLERQRWSDAAQAFGRGLDLHITPARSDLHTGLGWALLSLDRLHDAWSQFHEAMAIDPLDVQACRGAVTVIELLNRTDRAADAWRALGSALARREQYEHAVPVFHEALTQQPQSLATLIELGSACLRLSRLTDARRHFESALALDPGHPRAQVGLGQVLQLTGDPQGEWLEGDIYRQRGDKRRFEQPHWQAESLSGKTILVWADEALGDTIRFARHIPPISQPGTRIIVECHRLLVPLLRSLPGVDDVVAKGAPLPLFDVQVALSALPRITGAGTSAYLQADPRLIEWWRTKLRKDDRCTIGLVWSGDPKGLDAKLRFTSLSTFAPLADLDGTRFVSLQFGLPAIEAFAPPPGLHVEIFPEVSRSIADEAALMCALDLIVTVDTMSAHLAGALGRPVWTLLNYSACRRWRNDRDTSGAYPTMRLFRQREAGNWPELLTRVRASLRDVLDSSASAHDARRRNPAGDIASWRLNAICGKLASLAETPHASSDSTEP